MKHTRFSHPLHKDFANCLEDANRGARSLWQTFSDFLECSYLSVSQAAHKLQHGALCPDKEQRYLDAIRKQQHPEKFPKSFAILVEGLERDRYDFLGTVASELELLNQWNGQFFTPRPISEMMASMIIGEPKPDRAHRLTICEPACGAGAMAIAAARHLQHLDFYPWHYWLDCQDVDFRMFQACYVQLTLCGIPAVVRRGNTLSSETPFSELTLLGAMHPRIFTAEERATAEAERARLEALRSQGPATSVADPPRPQTPSRLPRPRAIARAAATLTGQTEFAFVA